MADATATLQLADLFAVETQHVAVAAHEMFAPHHACSASVH